MEEIVEIGKISSRGQIAVPADIRRKMKLKEGQKVLFVLGDDTLLVKKIMPETFAQITQPLREAAKKTDMEESNVPDMIHRFRKKKRQ
jgi:AbrB family looped-hinge helix DNA binding protein